MEFLKKYKTLIVNTFLFFLAAGMLIFTIKGFAQEEEPLQQETQTAQEKPQQETEKTAKGTADKMPKISGGTWERSGEQYSYHLPDGTYASGWAKIGGKVYYFGKDTFRVTGMKKIDKAWFYFSKKGVRKSGWKKVDGKKYYFDKKNSCRRAVGWTKIGKYKYYFKRKGTYRTGWMKEDGASYYFLPNGHMAKGWQVIRGKRYYFKKNGMRAVGDLTIKGSDYYFTEAGTLLRSGYTQDGRYVDSGGHVLQKSTIKQLLKTALKPVGSTMYVWGGGWDASDAGADITARTIGVNPQWKAFFQRQSSSYDYRTTRYQSKNGLDCSGYVGWVIYNTFNKTSGNAGFVMLAQVMAKTFSGYGWGSYTPAASVSNFKAGDIMSTSAGHVYIVVGQCPDSSIVLLHSSPCGVMITGTATRSGNLQSNAVSLAEQYMKKYYPGWYAKYPKVSRSSSYLTSYSQMRWYTGTKQSMMSDPEGYLKKNAAQILKDLFK